MSGSDEIYSVAFKQSGVIRVDEMEELFDAAIVFSQNIPKGNGVGIIANGGGAGIVAADLCEKYNIEIPELNQITINEIKKVSKLYAAIRNPLDTAADNDYKTYFTSIDGMLKDSNIDAIIVIYVHTALADAIPPANAIIDASKNNDKPIITCFFGGHGYEKGVKIIENAEIPNYITPERAVRALNYLLRQKECLGRKT